MWSPWCGQHAAVPGNSIASDASLLSAPLSFTSMPSRQLMIVYSIRPDPRPSLSPVTVYTAVPLFFLASSPPVSPHSRCEGCTASLLRVRQPAGALAWGGGVAQCDAIGNGYSTRARGRLAGCPSPASGTGSGPRTATGRLLRAASSGDGPPACAPGGAAVSARAAILVVFVYKWRQQGNRPKDRVAQCDAIGHGYSTRAEASAG